MMIEKTLISLLGALAGAAASLILLKSNLLSMSQDFASVTVILCITLGVLAGIAISEGKEKKRMKENNMLRDETVALITHEMRTGLTSTTWAIERMLDRYGKQMTAEDAQFLQEILKSIKGIVIHSVNLLDLSLLDIGKLRISRKWVPLTEVESLCREVVEKYAMGAEKHLITFTSSIRLDHSLQVEVDMMRLRIIIENLLENAIQYSVGDIRKMALEVVNEGPFLQIRVSDSGIGIPKDEQDKIFTEFYRASNARKELSAGSGIGLYTTMQYVKAHGGSMRFESTENVGTTFFVTIPLKTMADVNSFVEKIS